MDIVAAALLVTALAGPPADAGDRQAAAVWRTIEPGLEFAEMDAPVAAGVGDSRIRVLRIDPARFELRLLNASAEGATRTAREWCESHGLVAAINASMYQTDHRTSVSYMRTGDHVNNARVSRDKAALAFHPRAEGLPPVAIVDRECDDLEAAKEEWGTLVQSIRMVSCHGDNCWSQQPRRWSTAAIGIDGAGRVLFIHVRSPYTVHDLIDMLLTLPIDLERCMYVEGGPEAQLYFRSGETTGEFVGSFESGFFADDSNAHAWPIPNVVGVARRGVE